MLKQPIRPSIYVSPVENLLIPPAEYISDGAVLQRDTEIKIWGWASPEEEISVHFKNKIYLTKTDNQGNWHITMPVLFQVLPLH